jgi:hypothetical protein
VLRKTLFKPEAVKAWAVVVYDPQLNQNQILNFLKIFVSACGALGELSSSLSSN